MTIPYGVLQNFIDQARASQVQGLLGGFQDPGVQVTPSGHDPVIQHAGSPGNPGNIDIGDIKPADLPGAGKWAQLQGLLNNPAINGIMDATTPKPTQAQDLHAPELQRFLAGNGFMPGSWQYQLPQMAAFGFLPSLGIPRSIVR